MRGPSESKKMKLVQEKQQEERLIKRVGDEYIVKDRGSEICTWIKILTAMINADMRTVATSI